MKKLSFIISLLMFTSCYGTQNLDQQLLDASKAGDTGLMEQLIEKGANVNARDLQMETPLHWAAKAENPLAVKILLDEGVKKPGLWKIDVTPLNLEGTTPLHSAAMKGDVKTIDMLLQYGADPNRKASSGKTPLDDAVESGKTEAADLLRNKGGISGIHPEVTPAEKEATGTPQATSESPSMEPPATPGGQPAVVPPPSPTTSDTPSGELPGVGEQPALVPPPSPTTPETPSGELPGVLGGQPAVVPSLPPSSN